MQATKEMVQRLLQYKNILYKLRSMGFVKVFSDNLGDALGVSSSLVRKDFSAIEIGGNKRGGYRINDLLDKLNDILGRNRPQRIIIVGCGNIGRAFMHYNSFARDGVEVAAAFDVDPDIIMPNNGVPILDARNMSKFIAEEDIRIAILAVPESAAARTLETLREAGIRGVLNFAPIQLKSTDTCIIHNINFRMEIEHLFYYVNFLEREDTPA